MILALQPQFGGLVKANNSCSAGQKGTHSGLDKVSDAIIVEEDDGENGDFDGAVNAAEANGSGLRANFCEMQTECRAVRTDVSAGLVDVMQIAKRSITIEGQIRESDQELKKTQIVLQVTMDAILEVRYLALRNSEEARSCRQHVKVWRSSCIGRVGRP